MAFFSSSVAPSGYAFVSTVGIPAVLRLPDVSFTASAPVITKQSDLITEYSLYKFFEVVGL